jgi:hypothetical protein
MGFIAYLVGLIADLVSNNRQLVEMILEQARQVELNKLREKKGQSRDD